MNGGRKALKNKRIWLLGTIGLIVIMLGIGGFFFAGRNTLSGGKKIEKNTIEWNQDMDSADKNAEIQIPYYSDIYMEEGTDSIDMVLVNPKENECYFAYAFILRETGEEIYRSDLIEPGRALDKVKLNKKMESGKYKLNILVDTYSMKDQKVLNNAIVSTNLVVS